MALDLLKYFPYPEPRQNQRELLELLGREWDNFDVFVISAPTAFGKTSISKTLMNALRSVSVITPTNMLVSQFIEEFPDTPTLSRLDSYWCEEWQRPCPVTRGRLMKFCSAQTVAGGCPCSRDLATAKYRKGPGIYNYHTYLSHKLYRDVLVVDEAHNLINVIQDRQSMGLWKHDWKYPSQMHDSEQMLAWVQSLSPKLRARKGPAALEESCVYRDHQPPYIPQRTTASFNGKGTIRGEPEERDILKLLPVDVRNAPPMFWPAEVKKTVLLSATISSKDIERLGLEGGGGRRRVAYIDCKSPIPSGNRPIIADCLISVNRYNMESSARKIAEYIQELAVFHQGEKGVVHATYELSRLLRNHLGGEPRYIFHDKENKKEQYGVFRDSPAEEGRILVACGMYEGVDLPEDLGRWQVISKIPWQSLGSPAIKYLADKDPEWFLWETLKTTIQAGGRICRTPTDFGATYVFDRTFLKLLEEARHMMPQWYLDALVFPAK